ncbi:MAG TPA: aspartate/glutamate racemase family protein, partial [Chitinophagaceae bacterium]
GDNARAPYGTRSFETVYRYTLESVRWLFDQGCQLVILACNTASAKALRTIQQNDLPHMDAARRVLGVIRPTAEMIGSLSESKQVGILGTSGTINSRSYLLEIQKFYPDVKVYQQACPMWVPLIENNEGEGHGADYFVRKYIHELLAQDVAIDTILLACTHYPLLLKKIRDFSPADMRIVAQGEIVAASLAEYLKRHPDMEARCSKNGGRQFFTTDSVSDFNAHATAFFGETVQASFAELTGGLQP